MRQRLHQLELGTGNESDQALGDTLVVDGILDRIAGGSAPAIHRQFQIDQHLLLDTTFPVDEADDALDLKTTQKYAVADTRVVSGGSCRRCSRFAGGR